MKAKSISWLPAALLLTLPGLMQAQPIVAAHYPAGAEGLKGSSLPPPGLYFRDYNIGYWSDDWDTGPPQFDISAYVNAARLIWISEYELFGANWGMDLIVPFGYMDWDSAVPGIGGSYAGIGDIQFEPLLLSWHFPTFDLAAGYAVWAPTGDYSPLRPDILAKGFWSHMLTLGATFYFDEQKTWSLSLLNRYEFCHEQDQTNIDPGQVYTLEWGLGKSFCDNTVDVGLVGYYQQQTTSDGGSLFASMLKDRKSGIGAEVNVLWPKLGAFTSLRYVHEFDAKDRPEGDLVTFTFTKPF
jgi:hypothetical protein